ncbi:MAG: PilZ domain-containing protein [Acidobacteria bacterium]|nr:PilZ domain-containing protein [Acidobacteriota bacterium]
MARKRSQEKRRHPRVARRVPVRSRLDPDEPLEMESLNLSLEGLYCTTSRFVPVMTKLRITLDLPPPPARNPTARGRIEADAVVVRAEPGTAAETGKYRLALFFSGMDREDRIRLAEFLDRERKSAG